ncbi:hypothetical protein BW723_11130 [Polaribacter reichenbachii]|uniref:DUF748 domain-containing protein n=1 Tax=Polaribacter reichenbachii TaxID=996801 RepID=A0A1B8TPU3_9FLAO|nr:hypothetical protein [Polaribacter reichenbachii]APZ46803.1 hypothetical protein BW723_11130 [Polaribacter reichenbachii]AUC17446.1 hypothetical protein BTO17_01575 [Polaribacter reichenbachii]OBY61680.1 hypothetical protein LPB301_16635 [Polaribacter reichenbachii]
MNKKLYVKIAIIFVSIILLYKVADIYGTNKIDSFLKSKNFAYKEVSVNFLWGNLSLKDVNYQKDSLYFKADNIALEGFSYLKYFQNKEFIFSDLETDQLKISGNFLHQSKTKDTIYDDKNTKTKNLPKIKIKEIDLNNIEIDVLKKDKFPLTVKNVAIEIDDFELDTILKNSIPFKYSAIKTSIIGFESQFSKVQKIQFKKLLFETDEITVDSLEIVPLKSRDEYIYHLKKEKELLTLVAKEIKVDNIQLAQNEKMSFSIDNILLDGVFFNLYLDATHLKERTKIKNLYSKSLRELPFDIDVKNIDIINSEIVYEEYTKKGNDSGILVFDDLKAQIKNINNKINKIEKITTVNIQSKFMETSALNITWTFDINNKNDDFRITGSLMNVSSKNMSAFIQPTTNVKVKGQINKMYFDFEGNNNFSNGKMEMDFKNFDIQILDDKKKKKTIISWVVNLFVKDSSKNGMVKVDVKEVERNKTKSFWNYLWISIESGLQKSLL